MFDFATHLEQVIAEKKSDLALILSPRLVKMPLPMKRHDDPFLPFGKAIIRATRDLVVAYIFDLASYLRLGAAGAIALERTISYATGDNLLILHGPFSGVGFSEISDENAFGVDAVTLADSQHLGAYLSRGDRSAFILRNGMPQLVDAPKDGGFYWYDAGMLTTTGKQGDVITLRVIGEDALYASSDEDYAQHTRRVLEALR